MAPPAMPSHHSCQDKHQLIRLTSQADSVYMHIVLCWFAAATDAHTLASSRTDCMESAAQAHGGKLWMHLHHVGFQLFHHGMED